MLTREESKELLEYLTNIRRQEYFDLTLNANSSAIKNFNLYKNCYLDSIVDRICKLTEKPKREIKVGDIYRDNAGRIVEIMRIDDEDPGFPIMDTDKNAYTVDGIFGNEDRLCDLDLSKKYKLMEIEV